MTDVLKRGKRVLVIGLVLATVVWSIGLAAVPLANAATLTSGDLIKASGAAVYYYASDGKRYVFPNQATYNSWFADFSGVKTITDAELAAITIGGNAVLRAGTKLVKITTDPKVYAVGPNGALHWVDSEARALNLFGTDWASIVVDVPDAFFTNYTIGSDLASDVHPDGALVQFAGDANTYLVEGGEKRLVDSAAFAANGYQQSHVLQVSSSVSYASGTALSGAVASLMDVAQLDGSSSVPVGVGSGLTLALASDNPAAATVIADSTSADGAQALVSLVKANFVASADGAVNVTQLAFNRGGISSDSDLSALYLYEGDVRLAEYNSFSSGVITFTNSSGLFSVPAGSSKAVTLKADLANGVSSGKTLKASLAAADVVTDGASVSGSANGNFMTTAAVSDLGKLTLAHVSYPSSINPGTSNAELWKFSLAAADQDVKLNKLRLTMVGTASSDAFENLKLDVAGVLIGSSVAGLASDNTLEFDLSGAPYTITSGQTKNVSLRGDVVKGSSRNFYFSFQNMSDLVVMDDNYNVSLKPNQSDSFTIIKATAATTISSGSLTVSKSSDSATGNIALNATSVDLAKFDFKATGEDVKVSSLPVQVTCTTCTNVRNGKLFLGDAQVGTTQTLVSGSDVTFSFGNTFVIPAGETKVLTVKSDVASASGAADALIATDTVQVALSTGASNAQGKTSLTAISTTASTANALTVATGTASVAKNLAMVDGSSGVPTGVTGAANVRIASFVVSAGSGEGVNVSQIALTDDDTNALGTNLLNLRLEDADGNAIGDTLGTLSTSTGQTFSFTPATQIALAASEQLVVNVFADIKTGLSAGAVGNVKTFAIYATGQDTSTSADYTTEVAGQTIYISASGSVSATLDPSTPSGEYFVMGNTAQELARFKLTATPSENIDVTQVVISDTASAAGAIGTLMNIALFVDGSQVGSTLASFSTASAEATTTGYALFNLAASPLVIPSGQSKVLVVKADVNGFGAATAGSSHIFSLEDDYASTTGTQSAVSARGASTSTAIASVPSSDLNGSTFYVSRTIPTVAYPGLDVTTLSDGTVTLYKFTVTADAGADVSLKKITVERTLNDAGTGGSLATASWQWYDVTDATEQSLSTSAVSDGATVDLCAGACTNSTTEEVIAAGTTRTYEVRAVVSNSTANDSIQVRLSSDTVGTAVPDSSNDIEAYATGLDNFIWSDWSLPSHTYLTNDWYNGYLVSTLPSTYAVVSR